MRRRVVHRGTIGCMRSFISTRMVAAVSDLLFALSLLLVMGHLCSSIVHAEDDIVRFIENKQKELKEKEETLKKEEARLSVIKKDIDERIAKYERLLAELDEKLKRIEQQEKEQIGYVVKVYEAMTPEEAALRLSALDEDMAVKIMRGMKSKKAGPIMAFMEPKKAASITKEMSLFKARNREPEH